MEDMINWEVFVKLHCDEEVGIVIHTPLYNRIADNFPIALIRKLITISDYSCEYKLLVSAAVLIRDVAENSHFLQQLNRGINVDIMELLRLSAIDLMLNTVGIIELEQCGQVLASKILRSSLETDGEWDEFVQLTKRVFLLSQSILLYMFLDVLCALPSELVTKFVGILEPSIRESYALFPPRLISLLERGDDHRPYFVLANVCGLFTELQWSMMMEVAIMSSFFDNVYSSSSRVSVASSLKICFDHDADFDVSTDMVSKMRGIINCLHKSREPLEQHAAVELYEAFARKVLHFPIPRKNQ